MHVMLKRAAASAIPALVGLAVFPATAMAAPLPLIGGAAHGVIIYGKDRIIGNEVNASGSIGIDNRSGYITTNGIVGTAGNSVGGRVTVVGRQ